MNWIAHASTTEMSSVAPVAPAPRPSCLPSSNAQWLMNASRTIQTRSTASRNHPTGGRPTGSAWSRDAGLEIGWFLSALNSPMPNRETGSSVTRAMASAARPAAGCPALLHSNQACASVSTNANANTTSVPNTAEASQFVNIARGKTSRTASVSLPDWRSFRRTTHQARSTAKKVKSNETTP